MEPRRALLVQARKNEARLYLDVRIALPLRMLVSQGYVIYSKRDRRLQDVESRQVAEKFSARANASSKRDHKKLGRGRHAKMTSDLYFQYTSKRDQPGAVVTRLLEIFSRSHEDWPARLSCLHLVLEVAFVADVWQAEQIPPDIVDNIRSGVARIDENIAQVRTCSPPADARSRHMQPPSRAEPSQTN